MLALARYNSDGSLDATFGNGGTVVTDFGQGLESYALELMIQPDGRTHHRRRIQLRIPGGAL